MPTDVQRDQVMGLVADGAQLVDVLPRATSDAEHIAGAIGIPLKMLDRQPPVRLDPMRPVVTYYWDLQ